MHAWNHVNKKNNDCANPQENCSICYEVKSQSCAARVNVTSTITSNHIASELMKSMFVIRKQRFKICRAFVKIWLYNRKCSRPKISKDVAGVFITAMTYNICFVDPLLVDEQEIISYEHDTESFVSDVVSEYQQCRMECKHSCFCRY